MKALAGRITAAYGALLMAPPAAAALLLAASLTQPVAGLAGLSAAIIALGTRRVLRLPGLPGDLDLLNAALVGLGLFALYAPDPRSLLLLACAGAGTALAAGWVQLHLRGPVLSLPAALVSWAILPVAWSCAMPAADPALWSHLPRGTALGGAAGEWADLLLLAAGGMFGTVNIVAGGLVLAAVLVTSRVLLLLALAGFVLGEALLAAFTGTLASPLRIGAGANAMLAAVIIGGLYSAPTLRRLWLPALAVALTVPLTLALSALFAVAALPVLSLPFFLACRLCLALFRAERDPAYARLWLAAPCLPERAFEQEKQRAARGFADGSTPLALPFAGALDVYQGIDGAHTHQGPWRYAVDFHRVEQGRAFRGTGRRLEDYLCFGRAVLAPVAGWVVAARGDLPDNAPGAIDMLNNWGNHVLIRTVTGAHVLLAHLQAGSVGVAPGQWVAPGQGIGRIGNSGRSPQPHLHLHVQDGPQLGSPTRPFHLANVLLGGEWHLDLVPRAGDRLEAPQSAPALAAALALPVGRRLECRITAAGLHRAADITVRPDLDGTIRLHGAGGAAITLIVTEQCVALFDRNAAPDPVLDAFALAFGLTPTVEGVESWGDAPPRRLLPVRGWRGALLRACCPFGGVLASHYTRQWDRTRQVWRQSGVHRWMLAGWVLHSATTEVWFDETTGLRGWSLACAGRRLDARLDAQAGTADRGIPPWRTPAAEFEQNPSRRYRLRGGFAL